jgi:hypothetical protein
MMPCPEFRLSTLLWITMAVACWFGGMRFERWRRLSKQTDFERLAELIQTTIKPSSGWDDQEPMPDE